MSSDVAMAGDTDVDKSVAVAGSDVLSRALVDHDKEPSTMAVLPANIKRRVKALKKLQLQAVDIEAEFYRKVHDIECEFSSKYKPLNEKRAQIINGLYEPNEEDCDFPSDDELADELKDKATLNGPTDKPTEDSGTGEVNKNDVKGIPLFWVTLFRNVEILGEMVQEHDEPILSHLTDIDVQTKKDPMGFTLFFHFSPNEYFTNSVLTKEYSLKCEPDKEDPFEFDGPEIIACKGTHIDWKPGKNVTVKLIKKKQKHKTRGATRFVTKQVKNDSFFNFFDPPAIIPEDKGGVDDETREVLNADFEIGQIMRDRIVPRAVLYFTGEAHDDDESYDDEDEGDEDEDFDEDEDEEDDDGQEGETAKQPTAKPEECKQQ